MIRQAKLPDGLTVSVLGQGTWRMGEDRRDRAKEIEALRLGVALGMTLIDTAEMYADGGAESLVGEALAGLRDDVFLVSKAYPQNAGKKSLPDACERSLRRLKTDRLDLYLLHWRGNIPLAETIDAFEALRCAGKIGRWGVSNFDVDDMEELFAAGGVNCSTNQILYNLVHRCPEHDLLPWMAARGSPVMAYSPVEQGDLPTTGVLADIASRNGATPFQIALAWILRRPDTIAIPKASDIDHVRQNRGASDIVLSADELSKIDKIFKPPRGEAPLEVI